MKHKMTHIDNTKFLCPIITIVLIIGIALSVVSCSNNSASNSCDFNEKPLVVKYAQGFTLSQGEGYRRIDIINPWDTTRLLQTYLLVNHHDTLPAALPKGSIIRTPLCKTIVFSSVHGSLLRELNALDAIAGICDSEYFYIEELQERISAGTLVDAGSSLTPDLEQIIDLSPDAILLSPFENNTNERLSLSGIPIIECADYMETSPLGRAEWIRVFGWLYGCEVCADSLFGSVEQAYLSTKQKITQATIEKPEVITERRTGAMWYVPGGKSYMAKLLNDAGASYPWSDNNNTGSIALSFEHVFEQAQDADYWLIKYHAEKNLTYNDLLQEFAPYGRFKSFKENKIYGCNTHYLRYYEETPFHPERLLQDLSAIFHPTLFENYKPYYFHPIQQ